MRGYALLFCCALLVSIASGATYNFPNINTQVVEVWSDWYFVSFHGFDDEGALSIAITAEPADLDISPPTLYLNNVTREASFRIRPQVAEDFTITYTVSDGYFDVRFLTAVNRTMSVEGLSTARLMQGQLSEPFQLQLNYPSIDALTVTAVSSTGSVVFQPNPIVIPEGAIAATFNVIANVLEYSTVTYTVAGFEADLYAPVPVTTISNIYPRTVTIGDLSVNTLLGQNSTNFYVFTPIPTETKLTITPTAVDTIFTPHSVDLTPTTHLASFNYITSSPAYGARTVYFDMSGDGAGEFLASQIKYTTITKKLFTVQTPSTYLLHTKTYLSVRIGAPVVKDVTLNLYAGNLMFSPANITFKGDTTSVVVEVLPQALGQDVISFNIDGADKDWYTIPTSISLSVGGGTFISPNAWYVPWLWVGVESPKIPVSVVTAPNTNITLIPQAPDLIFTPPQLTFNSTRTLQYFTITPVYSNKAASDPTVSNSTVSFIVDGGDYNYFSPPSPFPVSVGRRSIQFRWSAHVTETTVGVKDLYLHKQYEFWATALYAPPSNLTVIPTNPYISFQPSVLQFSPTVMHIKVIATVESIGGISNIVWVMGGKCGGMYTTPSPQSTVTALRPLGLYQAKIAPDTRVYGGLLTDFTKGFDVSILGANHVHWFSLRSNVLPDVGVTITPKSLHLVFDPPSYEMTFDDSLLNLTKNALTSNGYPFPVPDLYIVSTNFSVTALAPGMHEVWFELSGPEAPYYDIPSNIWVMNTQELRLASETPSAASRSSSFALAFTFVVMTFLLLL